MREKWEKPELIVLVRGSAGEAVLLGCKLKHSGSGPGAQDGSCKYPPGYVKDPDEPEEICNVCCRCSSTSDNS